MYNEAIAIAVRRGAPLASYSIDRQCLRYYMTSSTHPGTHALVCLHSARRFAHIHGAKDYTIALRPLLSKVRDGTSNELSTCFLNLDN